MKKHLYPTPGIRSITQVILSLILGSVIITGCQSTPSQPPATATVSVLPPTATSTTTPSPTLTPTPLYKPNPISFANSGTWHFAAPYVFEDWPDLIISNNEAYELTENYNVQSIELSYQWWGLGDPVFNYQLIKKTGNQYLLAGKVVPNTKIEKFLKSIRKLHLTPLAISSITHTDDYPIWAVEITGNDGTKILLTSDSNTASYVPWNVIYNGDIYAQFDGAIPDALADLFSVSEGEPAAAFYPGGNEEGKLSVNSSGWPSQLTYGFNGLLPMHMAFKYQANSETGEVDGVIDGRSSIGGFGNMIIGSITRLEKIELEKSDKSKIKCSIESLKNNSDPSAIQWKFACPTEKPDMEGSYQYAVHVTFGTDKGEKIKSDGTLFGYWGNNILVPRVSFPLEIAQALANYEPYQELAKGHQVLLLNFDAKIDQVNPRLNDALNADLVLLGQVDTDHGILPYSVTTSFAVENGKVVRFDLDSSKLQSLLTDALTQSITRRLLLQSPNAILNLYYYENSKAVDVGESEGMNHSAANFVWRLAPCNGLPWRDTLPDVNTPLKGFSLDERWDTVPQFILLDGSVRVRDFFSPQSDSDQATSTTLLPKELTLQGKLPFRIRAYFDWGDKPYMSISWKENASQQEIAAYTEIIKKLPGEKEFFTWGATIKNAIFIVNESGTLDLVECKGSK